MVTSSRKGGEVSAFETSYWEPDPRFVPEKPTNYTFAGWFRIDEHPTRAQRIGGFLSDEELAPVRLWCEAGGKPFESWVDRPEWKGMVDVAILRAKKLMVEGKMPAPAGLPTFVRRVRSDTAALKQICAKFEVSFVTLKARWGSVSGPRRGPRGRP